MTRDDICLTAYGANSINVSDCDADACREFARHLRDIADSLKSGQFDSMTILGNTAKVLAACTPADGDCLWAACPDKVRSYADDYEAAADALGACEKAEVAERNASQIWRIEKRVANTEQWKVVGHASTKDEAVAKAKAVLGGTSTGVRICQTDSPYRTPEVVVGV